MENINNVPEINEGVVVTDLDPNDVMLLQAVFGQAVQSDSSGKIKEIINRGGPVLFAAVLFSMCEEWKIDETTPLGAIQGKSVVEAEESAIGWIRSVAQAMSKHYDGELTLAPSESEIDSDSELINPND